MIDEARKRLWLELSDLFFLGTEPTELHLEQAVRLVGEAGLTREQVRRDMIEIVARSAGDNLGYLSYPVVGEWIPFDPAIIMPRFEHSARLRATHPGWYFLIQDWFSRRLLKKLAVERLLVRLKS